MIKFFYTALYNTAVLKLALNKRRSKLYAEGMKISRSDHFWNWAYLFHLYSREYRLEKRVKFYRNKLDEIAADALLVT